MPQDRRWFYEVVSQHLLEASPIGFRDDLAAIRAAEVMTFLTILDESRDIPAADAGRLANLHSSLPYQLRVAGQVHLAMYAEKVLADLAGRKDDPKPEEPKKSEVTPVPPTV